MRAHRPLLVVALVAFAACRSGVAPTRTASHAADQVRERSRDLAAAESSRDVAAVMSFWSPDAIIHVEGAEAITGTSAIRATFEQLLPAIESLRVESDRIVTAKAGDMAYETGTNHLTLRSSTGSMEARSTYLIVWQRAPGEAWRVTALSITKAAP